MFKAIVIFHLNPLSNQQHPKKNEHPTIEPTQFFSFKLCSAKECVSFLLEHL